MVDNVHNVIQGVLLSSKTNATPAENMVYKLDRSEEEEGPTVASFLGLKRRR